MTGTRVVYEGGLRCRAGHGESDSVIDTDAPKDHGGRGETFSPSEMLSVSLGRCVLSMMALTARSLGLDLAGASASVGTRMGDAPRRIVELAVDVHVPGSFDPDPRRRLDRLGRLSRPSASIQTEASAEAGKIDATPTISCS